MRHEGPPLQIFNEDGSINEPVLNEQYGLGIQEATQEVQFGNYTGTVAEMLADERCPVGGMIRSKYEQGGIDAVTQQFTMLSMMDPNFNVEISIETIQKNQERDQEKKSGTTDYHYPGGTF